ncbi:flagellar assembly protein FliH [Pragia fontium]|uniref:Flagellar assembly protein FliH n=2 Tax=Pragia fontium TaxID=82985 RepID=A0AAJ5BFS0_9GAMM|nr:flagellar assembly protein FliH [Pragia fontium]AKJ41374.1 flagellar assembly protein H [Pragia fontium]SFC02113.1 flagellar assembly protein FliH [Pragia fontium DSM 5563 = ATCC 49100]SUB81622.1 flagellar assembly protein H [Pragia fontium]VEJ54084.1 flagellar assembly protein H [Pragia fontium]GKX62931.1 flagellar assembly protein H [Pragia fontium]
MSDGREKLNLLTQKNSRNAGKYRVHQFPPLRKRWEVSLNESQTLEPAEYQQQLMNGFQEGLDKGFEQGVNQGKEEGYQEGLRLGFEEGLKKGNKEGSLEGRAMFERAADPLDGMVQQFQTFLDNYEVQRRTELLQLVDKVTRQVIRCELALQPTQLLALVEEALAGLPEQPKQIRVHVNPEEFSRLNDAEPEKVREWGLTPDANMEHGECRVATDTTEIDVGCQHRLDQCIDVLKENLLPPEVERETGTGTIDD